MTTSRVRLTPAAATRFPDIGTRHGSMAVSDTEAGRWYRAPFMTPEAWERFEHLWCRTPLSAEAIRDRMRRELGIEIIDPQETAARRGLVRLNSTNPHAREERRQLAALQRWYAPPARLEAVRKPARRYPVPTGGFRLGRP